MRTLYCICSVHNNTRIEKKYQVNNASIVLTIANDVT